MRQQPISRGNLVIRVSFASEVVRTTLGFWSLTEESWNSTPAEISEEACKPANFLLHFWCDEFTWDQFEFEFHDFIEVRICLLQRRGYLREVSN